MATKFTKVKWKASSALRTTRAKCSKALNAASAFPISMSFCRATKLKFLKSRKKRESWRRGSRQMSRTDPQRVLSGMRPTGPLHLGHLFGALDNWTKLQQSHECFFMGADLHALMGEYENPFEIQKNSIEMVIDWLACGIDPKKSVIFVQSQIPEHSELAFILF